MHYILTSILILPNLRVFHINSIHLTSISDQFSPIPDQLQPIPINYNQFQFQLQPIPGIGIGAFLAPCSNGMLIDQKLLRKVPDCIKAKSKNHQRAEHDR